MLQKFRRVVFRIATKYYTFENFPAFLCGQQVPHYVW